MSWWSLCELTLIIILFLCCFCVTCFHLLSYHLNLTSLSNLHVVLFVFLPLSFLLPLICCMTFIVKIIWSNLHVCYLFKYLPHIDLPVFLPVTTLFSGLLSWWYWCFWGVFLWNDLCLAVLDSPLVPHLPALHAPRPHPASPWPLTIPGCSSALAALLAPPFLSRPLPPLTGLALP